MAYCHFPDYEYDLPQNIIESFFDKYVNLKYFALFRFDDGKSQQYY